MHKSGSLLSELLAVLLAISLFMPFLYEAVLKSSALAFDYKLIQDEISSLQLRRILALAYDLKVEGKTLYFEYEGRECLLTYKNESVQMSPGTLIFYDDVLDVEFSILKDVITIHLKRKEGEVDYVLASQKGIDFASFYDDVDDDLELESELSNVSQESK